MCRFCPWSQSIHFWEVSLKRPPTTTNKCLLSIQHVKLISNVMLPPERQKKQPINLTCRLGLDVQWSTSMQPKNFYCLRMVKFIFIFHISFFFSFCKSRILKSIFMQFLCVHFKSLAWEAALIALSY